MKWFRHSEPKRPPPPGNWVPMTVPWEGAEHERYQQARVQEALGRKAREKNGEVEAAARLAMARATRADLTCRLKRCIELRDRLMRRMRLVDDETRQTLAQIEATYKT